MEPIYHKLSFSLLLGHYVSRAQKEKLVKSPSNFRRFHHILFYVYFAYSQDTFAVLLLLLF